MKLVTIPEEPLHTPRATAVVPMRYEDIAQDGRMLLEFGGKGIGEVVWRELLEKAPQRDLMISTGIVPILTRYTVVGGTGPFSVNAQVTGAGTYALGQDGERVYLDMWTTLLASHGSSWEAQPDRGGPPVVALSTFAEHVMTRLFAPPNERKVSSLPGIDLDPRRFALPDREAMLVLPERAEPLDAELRPDSVPWVFGLRHTDSNQHVNSLVYPQLFEEALLRRALELGRSTSVLATEIDCAYRKPCFAGDVVRWWLRAFLLDGQLGAVGVLVEEGATPHDDRRRPRTYARLLMA